MKKFLIGLGIIVTVLVILGIVFRGPLMMMAGMAFMQPDHSFADDKTAPAPDYANPEHWAALPELEDSADGCTQRRIHRSRQHQGSGCFFYSSHYLRQFGSLESTTDR